MKDLAIPEEGGGWVCFRQTKQEILKCNVSPTGVAGTNIIN